MVIRVRYRTRPFAVFSRTLASLGASPTILHFRSIVAAARRAAVAVRRLIPLAVVKIIRAAYRPVIFLSIPVDLVITAAAAARGAALIYHIPVYRTTLKIRVPVLLVK